MQPAAEMLRKVIYVNERRSISTYHITNTRETREYIKYTGSSDNRGMVDSILHESPLGKSDHCVLVITSICYAELVGPKYQTTEILLL